MWMDPVSYTHLEFSVAIEDLKDKARPHKGIEIPQASVDKDIEKWQFLQASRDNSLFCQDNP